MHRAGYVEPPTRPEEWAELFRNLTHDYPDDEPWCLLIEDPAQPAFMQCPSIQGFEDYRKSVSTPDDLDILVSAKNHDVKKTVAIHSAYEDWIFALVNLQTMAGFLGQGNYGIARMNGGFSARPCLGLAPVDGGAGAHLFFDVVRMIAGRDEILQEYPEYYQSVDGQALLWLVPWDGQNSSPLRGLDPYFIEICRRVRLRAEKGSVYAQMASSKRSRLSGKEAKGDLGDFWMPVDIGGGKALSVSGAGFSYKLLVSLILKRDKYRLPLAMKVPSGNARRWSLVARSVAGGQGKTEGYHERTDIAFNPKVASAFASQEKCEILGVVADAQLEEISATEKALRLGVAVAASGGGGEVSKEDYAQAYPPTNQFNDFANAIFFSSLEDRFLAPNDQTAQFRRAEFARRLIRVAHRLLSRTIETVPCAAIYRYRAQAQAERAFWGSLHKQGCVFSDQPEILSEIRRDMS